MALEQSYGITATMRNEETGAVNRFQLYSSPAEPERVWLQRRIEMRSEETGASDRFQLISRSEETGACDRFQLILISLSLLAFDSNLICMLRSQSMVKDLFVSLSFLAITLAMIVQVSLCCPNTNVLTNPLLGLRVWACKLRDVGSVSLPSRTYMHACVSKCRTLPPPFKTWSIGTLWVYVLACNHVSNNWLEWPPTLIQQGIEPHPGPEFYVHVSMNIKSLSKHWYDLIPLETVHSFALQESWHT